MKSMGTNQIFAYAEKICGRGRWRDHKGVAHGAMYASDGRRMFVAMGGFGDLDHPIGIPADRLKELERLEQAAPIRKIRADWSSLRKVSQRNVARDRQARKDMANELKRDWDAAESYACPCCGKKIRIVDFQAYEDGDQVREKYVRDQVDAIGSGIDDGVDLAIYEPGSPEAALRLEYSTVLMAPLLQAYDEFGGEFSIQTVDPVMSGLRLDGENFMFLLLNVRKSFSPLPEMEFVCTLSEPEKKGGAA